MKDNLIGGALCALYLTVGTLGAGCLFTCIALIKARNFLNYPRLALRRMPVTL